MRHLAFSLVLLAILAPSATAKNKPVLPALIWHAKYVFITTYEGDPYSNPGLYSEDRHAVNDVTDAVRQWGRYIVVLRKEDADLILLVRKGRIAEVTPGIHIHAGSGAGPALGPDIKADAGDPLDTLSVYDAAQGTDTAPLWRGRLQDGLTPPSMRLVKEFRDQVEEAARQKP